MSVDVLTSIVCAESCFGVSIFVWGSWLTLFGSVTSHYYVNWEAQLTQILAACQFLNVCTFYML